MIRLAAGASGVASRGLRDPPSKAFRSDRRSSRPSATVPYASTSRRAARSGWCRRSTCSRAMSTRNASGDDWFLSASAGSVSAIITKRRWASRCPEPKSRRSCWRTFSTARCWFDPSWAPALEAALFLLLGAAARLGDTDMEARRRQGYSRPAVSPRPSVVAYIAFRWHRLVLDAATPAVGILVLFGALLVLTLAEAARNKRALERAMQVGARAERPHGRRARRGPANPDGIPAGCRTVSRRPAHRCRRGDGAGARGRRRSLRFLPSRRPPALPSRRGRGGQGSVREHLHGRQQGALQERDAAGGSADIGALMVEANAEVSRDNPQMLFVTAFAGVLDLDTGDLDYCNAGHENPFVVDPAGTSGRRLEDGGGPPLCTVDAFAYRGARDRLRTGELLCVISDGVTEAQSRAASCTAACGCATRCALRCGTARRQPRGRRHVAARCGIFRGRHRARRRHHGAGAALERSRAKRGDRRWAGIRPGCGAAVSACRRVRSADDDFDPPIARLGHAVRGRNRRARACRARPRRCFRARCHGE